MSQHAAKHHKKAAEYHSRAAEQHKQASRHYAAGNYRKGAYSAQAEAAKRLPQPAPIAKASVNVSGPFERVVTMMGLEPINKAEACSLYALLAWVADNQNMAQETVQSIVEAYLRVGHIEKINRIDYQSAVDFLVNLRLNELH